MYFDHCFAAELHPLFYSCQLMNNNRVSVDIDGDGDRPGKSSSSTAQDVWLGRLQGMVEAAFRASKKPPVEINLDATLAPEVVTKLTAWARKEHGIKLSYTEGRLWNSKTEHGKLTLDLA